MVQVKHCSSLSVNFIATDHSRQDLNQCSNIWHLSSTMELKQGTIIVLLSPRMDGLCVLVVLVRLELLSW